MLVHDFHVSKMDINHNSKTSSWEVTLHVFTDDLELSMNKAGYSVKGIGTDKETTDTEKKIASFFHKYISIYVDGVLQKPEYIGKEEADRFDAAYLYFEFPANSAMKELKIVSNLFHNVFDDQKNILTVTYQKKLKGFFITDQQSSTQSFHLQ